MTQQMQQECPQAAMAFDQSAIPTNFKSPAIAVAVDNTVEQKNKEIAHKIAGSERPIIFISEQSAKSYGMRGKYVADIFPNVPVIFENEAARKGFIHSVGPDRQYYEEMTLGVAKVNTANESVRTVFDSCDCVIVLGTPKQECRNALESLKSDKCDIFISETVSSADDRVRANVSFPLIGKASDGMRSDRWLSDAKRFRPSVF